MTRSIFHATAAAVLLPLPAWAAAADDPATTLPEVVVTATRLPAIVAGTPGARVIDRPALDQRGAVFAADILSDVPGLSVVRSGAFGGGRGTQQERHTAAPGQQYSVPPPSGGGSGVLRPGALPRVPFLLGVPPSARMPRAQADGSPRDC